MKFNLQLIHGHDMHSAENAITLDNALGKYSFGGLQEENFIEPWYINHSHLREDYAYGDRNHQQDFCDPPKYQLNFAVTSETPLTNASRLLLFSPKSTTPFVESGKTPEHHRKPF